MTKTASRRVPGAVLLCLLIAARASAAPPEVKTLVQNMRAVVWPAQPSLRKLTITIEAEHGEPTQWVADQARKRAADGGRMLTVLQAPQAMRGISWLVQEGPQQTVQWVWVPAVGRVRQLVPVDGQEAFLGSDFTYADLGVVDLHSSYKLLGGTSHDGVRAYEIEEVPSSRWYYARIVTWIAADSGFPLERQFYDPANRLWKVEHFEQVTAIDGVQTVLRRRMEDRQTGGSTVIDVSDVRYGADLPDSLFDPAHLPKAIDWTFKR
jgi:uncharacterized protein